MNGKINGQVILDQTLLKMEEQSLQTTSRDVVQTRGGIRTEVGPQTINSKFR